MSSLTSDPTGQPAVAQSERPHRGELWLVAMGAARKGDMGKTRPALVISVDGLQQGTPYDLITVVPVTTSARKRPSLLQPTIPAGTGLDVDSVILCHAPRAIVPSRFLRCLGRVPSDVFDQVIDARAMIEGWDD